MPRYFIEVAYVGTNYAGFQTQKNANTIQAEIERALYIFYKQEFELTGSSRTDAGVHAYQNYFHFDSILGINVSDLYNLNALLKHDIVIKNIFEVNASAHCRFDALSRTYHYFISRKKNPFLYERAYYYPYKINILLLQEFAATITEFNDFTSFSKRKTQVNHFICNVLHSKWFFEDDIWRYEIKADRFLRGMVKSVVGTMLHLAKNDLDADSLRKIFNEKNCEKANFSPPSQGLFLMNVELKPLIVL